MQKSEKTDLIFKALSAAQGEFVTLKKDKYDFCNKGVHNSTFADLSSFLDMVRSVFSRHNLWLEQPVKYDDNMIVISTFIGHGSGQFLQFYHFVDVTGTKTLSAPTDFSVPQPQPQPQSQPQPHQNMESEYDYSQDGYSFV